MMQLGTPNCPECQGPAIGTLERLTGTALLVLDGNQATYSGGTDVDYDSQETIKQVNPAQPDEECVTLVCDEAHEWFSTCKET